MNYYIKRFTDFLFDLLYHGDKDDYHKRHGITAIEALLPILLLITSDSIIQYILSLAYAALVVLITIREDRKLENKLHYHENMLGGKRRLLSDYNKVRAEKERLTKKLLDKGICPRASCEKICGCTWYEHPKTGKPTQGMEDF